MWKIDDPEGNETAKVRYDVVRYTRGIGLDLGCGAHKLWPRTLGVDSGKDTALFGTAMAPDIVCDVADPAAIAASFHPASVPYVYSSHVLEHVDDYRAALRAWWSLVQVDGHLILHLPHADHYPHIGQPGANPDHRHDFQPNAIIEAMATLVREDEGAQGWELLVDEVRDSRYEYSFLQVYRKRADRTVIIDVGAPMTQKRCCVVRHGGIGDQLQAAHLFPALKRAGYHITVVTTDKGRDPIAHDPHVDDWFLLDHDQIPNVELGAFWKALKRRYDKFINLNESVEGVWLALPGRINHTWDQPLRHAMLNHNYAEWHARLADLPFVAEGQFYATDAERKWARGLIGEWSAALNADEAMPLLARAPYVVLFALAGSSPHKFTPHQDAVIRAIHARMKRALIVLVGDMACKILEAGLDDLPRVKCLSGELSVRETLALAQQANLVIGPETGVLNAVCYDATIAKVVLLSHSSHENLTKHWLNTWAIDGVAPCFPCHQLHYTSEHCPQDEETHAAICQRNVDPAAIYAPIEADYAGWARVAALRAAA